MKKGKRCRKKEEEGWRSSFGWVDICGGENSRIFLLYASITGDRRAVSGSSRCQSFQKRKESRAERVKERHVRVMEWNRDWCDCAGARVWRWPWQGRMRGMKTAPCVWSLSVLLWSDGLLIWDDKLLQALNKNCSPPAQNYTLTPFSATLRFILHPSHNPLPCSADWHAQMRTANTKRLA